MKTHTPTMFQVLKYIWDNWDLIEPKTAFHDTEVFSIMNYGDCTSVCVETHIKVSTNKAIKKLEQSLPSLCGIKPIYMDTHDDPECAPFFLFEYPLSKRQGKTIGWEY
jgi:hypothetical protein